MKKIFPILWLLKKIRRRIPGMTLLILANAGSAIFNVVFALGTRNVIDAATGGDSHVFMIACLEQGAIILGILLCNALARHLNDRLKADLDRDWKKQMLGQLLRGEYAAVSEYHSGELINRLNNDVRIVDDGMVGAIPGLVSMVVRLVSAMIVLTSLEPWFALVILGLGFVVVLLTGFMRSRLKDLHKWVSEKDGLVSSFMQETLEKLLMVQALDVSGQMEERADLLLEQRYVAQRARKNVSLFANTSVNVMSLGAGFVALLWCALRLLNGTMSFGSLTAVTQLVSQLQSPFVHLSSVIPQYIAMTASAERLMELETIPNEAAPISEPASAIYEKMQALEGRGVVFSYDRNRVLDGVSFQIPKNSFVAVTGPSGMGKSTLLKLLLGIFHPQQGELSIDCGTYKLPIDRGTRKLFAYVPQGNLLLSGTLRENLLLVKPDATQEELEEAIYVSAMDGYLSQLPKGLDTVLGESGAGLSEGQAQRLAIARAVLSQAPILLLDESTSALDKDTEHQVLNRIRNLKNRTCIAVTHRPATMEICDMMLDITGESKSIASVDGLQLE